MTREEYNLEWKTYMDEMRGIIAGAGNLTEQQEAQARREAQEHMDKLEQQEEKQ